MSLLKTLALSSVANILLGLLFSIIVMLFIVISILLIYSLLMISVETKTFESGVMRLLGISKWNVITMILIQSLLFVIPSIICAYCLSIPTLLGIFKAMFKGTFDLTPIPSANATLQGVLLGLFIPIVSSIIPIQVALSKNLCESINNSRSKSQGQKVDISDAESFKRKLPYLLFGGIGTAAGITIYFVMPLAVLTADLGLLFEIFFLILVGMILGLALIALNV